MLTKMSLAALALTATAAVAQEIPEGLEEHYICNETAARVMMDEQSAQLCALNYTNLKLQFVEDGPNLEQFLTLSPVERAAFMREGYAGFKAWEEENAALSASLYEAAGDIVDAERN